MFSVLIFMFYIVSSFRASFVLANVKYKDDIASIRKVNQFFTNDLNHFMDFARSVHKRSISNQTEEQKNVAEKFTARCSACILLVSMEQRKIGKQGKTRDMKSALSWMETGCEYFDVEAPKVCKGVKNVFGDEIVQVFAKVNLRPEQICGISLPDVCTSFHHIDDSSSSWSVSIPPKVAEITNRLGSRNAPRLKVLHLSDIHIDMQYDVGSNAVCDEPVCCRQPISKSSSILDTFKNTIKVEFLHRKVSDFDSKLGAMKWGDYRNCDLPFWTFADLLKQLSEKAIDGKEQIDYILFTGDIPAHDIWAQTKKAQVDMIFNITATITKYFPNTPVFPAIGNHDSFPANNFPPDELEVEEQFRIDWLYETLAKAWKSWLPDDAIETVKRGGFYTTVIKPGFRIVSLNTNFCYSGNVWLWMGETDPDDMLAWFVDILIKAEQNNELVHVIGHVPPGRDPECLSTWSRNYFEIIERFQDVIAAQFFGHTHYDEVQVFHDSNGNPMSVAYVAPSVTTYTGMKPSYRTYEVESFANDSTWNVVNHQTYVMNLITANNTNKPVWELEYDACEAFNLTSLNYNNWNILLRQWLQYIKGEITQVPESLTRYLEFYLKLHPLVEGDDSTNNFNTTEFLHSVVCDAATNLRTAICSYKSKSKKKS